MYIDSFCSFVCLLLCFCSFRDDAMRCNNRLCNRCAHDAIDIVLLYCVDRVVSLSNIMIIIICLTFFLLRQLSFLPHPVLGHSVTRCVSVCADLSACSLSLSGPSVCVF